VAEVRRNQRGAEVRTVFGLVASRFAGAEIVFGPLLVVPGRQPGRRPVENVDGTCSSGVEGVPARTSDGQVEMSAAGKVADREAGAEHSCCGGESS
jgi:hypothetical protein